MHITIRDAQASDVLDGQQLLQSALENLVTASEFVGAIVAIARASSSDFDTTSSFGVCIPLGDYIFANTFRPRFAQ